MAKKKTLDSREGIWRRYDPSLKLYFWYLGTQQDKSHVWAEHHFLSAVKYDEYGWGFMDFMEEKYNVSVETVLFFRCYCSSDYVSCLKEFKKRFSQKKTKEEKQP